jgi:hypothetical protein
MVVLVGLATYGTTRFRFAAEPSFCVLAAVALTSIWVALPRAALHRPEHAAG